MSWLTLDSKLLTIVPTQRAPLPDAAGIAAADALALGARGIATAASTAGAASGGGRGGGAEPEWPTFVQVYSERSGKNSSHSQLVEAEVLFLR